MTEEAPTPYRPACEHCVYFDRSNDYGGLCRRVPPTVVVPNLHPDMPIDSAMPETVWPWVRSAEWCGAWTRIGRIKSTHDDPYGFIEDIATMGGRQQDGVDE
jgi:hypothetical protein